VFCLKVNETLQLLADVSQHTSTGGQWVETGVSADLQSACANDKCVAVRWNTSKIAVH
jgi:hypothetical protein